jgi:hypothetical protein
MEVNEHEPITSTLPENTYKYGVGPKSFSASILDHQTSCNNCTFSIDSAGRMVKKLGLTLCAL